LAAPHDQRARVRQHLQLPALAVALRGAARPVPAVRDVCRRPRIPRPDRLARLAAHGRQPGLLDCLGRGGRDWRLFDPQAHGLETGSQDCDTVCGKDQLGVPPAFRVSAADLLVAPGVFSAGTGELEQRASRKPANLARFLCHSARPSWLRGYALLRMLVRAIPGSPHSQVRLPSRLRSSQPGKAACRGLRNKGPILRGTTTACLYALALPPTDG